MWSPSVIQDINNEEARKAARLKKVPYIPTLAELEKWAIKPVSLPFPFLGDYLPEGWEIARDEDGDEIYWQVDSGGFGGIAISVDSFILKIAKLAEAGKEYGYAIRDQYQFCVDVFAYVRTSKKAK